MGGRPRLRPPRAAQHGGRGALASSAQHLHACSASGSDGSCARVNAELCSHCRWVSATAAVTVSGLQFLALQWRRRRRRCLQMARQPIRLRICVRAGEGPADVPCLVPLHDADASPARARGRHGSAAHSGPADACRALGKAIQRRRQTETLRYHLGTNLWSRMALSLRLHWKFSRILQQTSFDILLVCVIDFVP